MGLHLHNLSYLVGYIKSFGYWAPAILFTLFIIQAILTVIPFAILTAGAVLLFGVRDGFLLAFAGSLLGSVLSYFIWRSLGAEWFERTIKKRFGYDANLLNSNHLAFWGIVTAHVVQVVPGAVINAAAAVGGVSLGSFLLATAIGLIPCTVLYSGLGVLFLNSKNQETALAVLAACLLLFIVIKLLNKPKS